MFGFKIKLAEPKRKVYSSTIPKGKVVTGIVIEEEGILKVSVDAKKDGNGIKPPKIYNFTPESYDLTGRQTVFLKKKDKSGRRVRIIRDKNTCKYMPGLPEQYVPFAPNWVVTGYVVKRDIQKFFDFKDLVGINGYVIQEHDEEE